MYRLVGFSQNNDKAIFSLLQLKESEKKLPESDDDCMIVDVEPPVPASPTKAVSFLGHFADNQSDLRNFQPPVLLEYRRSIPIIILLEVSCPK